MGELGDGLMPLFEYLCQSCGNREERLFPNPPKFAVVYCSTCGEVMRRMPSAPSIKVVGGTPKYFPYGGGEE